MRPVPIAPTVIRLLGAASPNTDPATIEGKPFPIIADVIVALDAVSMNWRRETARLVSPILLPVSVILATCISPGIARLNAVLQTRDVWAAESRYNHILKSSL